jgi:hypothetical protein
VLTTIELSAAVVVKVTSLSGSGNTCPFATRDTTMFSLLDV